MQSTETEMLKVILSAQIAELRALAELHKEAGIPGWEDLRRQADEMEKRNVSCLSG